MNNSIKVQAPATIANVVCGFDLLGLAIDGIYDEMEVSLKNTPGITIVHEDNFGISTDPTKNISGIALQAMVDHSGFSGGFHLQIKKNIKPGSGLGSSAAAAAAPVVAANILLGNKYNNEQLLNFALEGEMIASGARHADNVAPCIYGGITLVKSLDPVNVVKIPAPQLYITVLHPLIEIKTAFARSILPEKITLAASIVQSSNLASLIAGLYTSDYNLISLSLQDDIVEPMRIPFIPHFKALKDSAMQAGALGGGISGSGPTVFMMSKTLDIAEEVERKMNMVYAHSNVPFYTKVSQICNTGVKVI